jgi:hypothetical protein
MCARDGPGTSGVVDRTRDSTSCRREASGLQGLLPDERFELARLLVYLPSSGRTSPVVSRRTARPSPPTQQSEAGDPTQQHAGRQRASSSRCALHNPVQHAAPHATRVTERPHPRSFACLLSLPWLAPCSIIAPRGVGAPHNALLLQVMRRSELVLLALATSAATVAEVNKAKADFERALEDYQSREGELRRAQHNLDAAQQNLNAATRKVQQHMQAYHQEMAGWQRELFDGAKHVQTGYAEQQARERRKINALSAHSIGYCVQDGLRHEDFADVINSMRSYTELPEERFAPGVATASYPLVLIFMHSPATPRYEELLKSSDIVKRCRAMLEPRGKLALVVFRPGNGFSTDETVPAAVDGLLEFGIKMSFGALNPLPDTDRFNDKSIAMLKSLAREQVPPLLPPKPECYFEHEPLKRVACAGLAASVAAVAAVGGAIANVRDKIRGQAPADTAKTGSSVPTTHTRQRHATSPARQRQEWSASSDSTPNDSAPSCEDHSSAEPLCKAQAMQNSMVHVQARYSS